jgi:Xaa-Pro dipeptidase
MTVGVGGSTAEAELAALKNMRGDVPPIGVDERLKRIARAQAIMREKGIDALYLDVSSSMTYFTGLKFRRTERMHSAVLPARGDIVYVSPAFEVEKLKTMLAFGDKIAVCEEDEDPTARSAISPAPAPPTRRRRFSPSTDCAAPATPIRLSIPST